MAFEIENGVLERYTEEENVTEVTIPDSVISIGNRAFSACKSLTSITISDSVKSIGYGAFYDCISLKSITIPDSVTSIGYSAFSIGIEIIICKGDVKVPFTLKGNWNFFKTEQVLNNFIVADVNDRQQHFDHMKSCYKIPIALFMAFAYPQETYYRDYLKNNAEDAGRHLIDEENIDFIYRFLDFGFVTENNIDSLISYAVEHTQNGGSAEPQLVLTRYKNDNFGCQGADVMDKFML